jgi:hypothetical protein
MAVGALALAMTTGTPSFGKSSHALMIRAVTVRGSEVAITIANLTAKAQAGTVSYRFLTSRGEVTVTVPVAAAAGQTVTIKAATPELILDEFPMGVVVDDGAPF